MSDTPQLPTFVATFPSMDTVNTKGAERTHNSTIQGRFSLEASKS